MFVKNPLAFYVYFTMYSKNMLTNRKWARRDLKA